MDATLDARKLKCMRTVDPKVVSKLFFYSTSEGESTLIWDHDGKVLAEWFVKRRRELGARFHELAVTEAHE
eukprot:11193663-Lingulodinium_polyedra.AAC.1